MIRLILPRLLDKSFIKRVDVNASNINVYEMRKHIGMVFQRPNPFAKSIYRNITFAHERKGVRDKQTLDEIVETSLKQSWTLGSS